MSRDEIESLQICPFSVEGMNERFASTKYKRQMSEMNSNEEFKRPIILSPHHNKEGQGKWVTMTKG